MTQLELIGHRIGQSLGEHLTKDTARFKDDLDIMKFICRDFWIALFQKQVDNLRTNHQVKLLFHYLNFKCISLHLLFLGCLCFARQQFQTFYSHLGWKAIP